tara:strand:- start:578 stop:1036 length:459 start_codon:yes stop_codon:yes gene_type:complete
MSSYVPNLTSMTSMTDVDLQSEKTRDVPPENESLGQLLEREKIKNQTLVERIEGLDREVHKSIYEKREREDSIRKIQRFNKETVDSLRREISAIQGSSWRQHEEFKANFDREVTQLRREKYQREALFKSMEIKIMQVLRETRLQATADSDAA